MRADFYALIKKELIYAEKKFKNYYLSIVQDLRKTFKIDKVLGIREKREGLTPGCIVEGTNK